MPNALIWGASGGIGSALVKQLKNNQWTVFAAARQTDKVPIEADEIYNFDASNPTTFKEVALMLAEDAQTLELVVYTAGGIRAERVEDIDSETWQSVMNANLNGAFLGVQSTMHLVPEGGHIMAIGAYTDRIMLPKFGAYTAAKSGLDSLFTIFRKEHRRVKFTIVRPPAVKTQFWNNVPFQTPSTALTPEQVAEAILTHYEQNRDGYLDL